MMELSLSSFNERRNFPNCPFHGGITIETAPSARAWQARRISGFGSPVSMYPNSLIFFPSRAPTSESLSAPPSTPTQQVPQEAERHSTGIGPSILRGSMAFQSRD